MPKEYVEFRNGGYWIAGTRVSLDSIVYAFRRGASPESVAQSFPVLTLEEVYGGIAFYLGHQAEIDRMLKENERESASFEKETAKADPVTQAKLRDARDARTNRQ